MVSAYLAALAPALLMALTQPVWSLVDEAQHFDFIVQLSHGVYPVVGRHYIAPETLAITQTTGVYRAFYPAGSYPTPDSTDAGPPPDDITVRANAVWMQRHMWQLSHESVQTPGYYLAMLPVWWMADRLLGASGAIYVLRIINALLIAALAPMTLAAARIVAPGRQTVAGLSVIFAALLPGLALNGTRISNDALAAALGGLILLVALRWAGTWTWRRAAVIGLLFGAALMVKITDAGLVGAVVASALWPAVSKAWRLRLFQMLVAGALAGGCLVPWFLVNLASYGALTPGALADRWSDALPGPLTGTFVALDLAVFVLTYWTGEPWGALPLAGLFAGLGGLIALTVPAAAIRLVRTRQTGFSIGPAAVCLAAVAGMIAVALLLPVAARFEFVGPGRYVYPALPAAAVLCALGVSTVVTSRRVHIGLAALFAVLASTTLIGGAAGLPWPPPAGAGAPPSSAAISTVEASGQFAGVTVTVTGVALDRAAGATWLRVTAANSLPDEIEWTVPPVVSTRGGAATGEYRRSTQLPGDLDAGQTVSGWLYVPLDPSGIRPGDVLHVRFVDIAASDYRSVGDVELDVRMPS